MISTKQNVSFFALLLPFLPLGHASSAAARLHQGCGCHLYQIWRKLLWSRGLHGPVCRRTERESSRHWITQVGSNCTGTPLLKSVYCCLLQGTKLYIPYRKETEMQHHLDQEIKCVRKDKNYCVCVCMWAHVCGIAPIWANFSLGLEYHRI